MNRPLLTPPLLNPPLLTTALRAKLVSNWLRNSANGGYLDFYPVLKVFSPDAEFTALLTELNPQDGDTVLGLFDWGHGKIGYHRGSLNAIAQRRGMWGLPVERDTEFHAQRPLSGYAARAEQVGRIE